MKINEVLAELRVILNHGPKSKDFRYDDRDLYYMLLKHRAELIRQRTDKHRPLSEYTYQTLAAVDLEEAPLFEVSCYTNGCIYKRSVSEFPEVVANRFGLIVKHVTDLEGNEIPFGRFESQRYDKYSLTKKEKPQAFILNNHLYIMHNVELVGVAITCVLYDPLTINDVQMCNETNECYDPFEHDFPCEKDLLRAAYAMVYEEIYGVSMKIPIDSIPDAATPLAQKERR